MKLIPNKWNEGVDDLEFGDRIIYTHRYAVTRGPYPSGRPGDGLYHASEPIGLLEKEREKVIFSSDIFRVYEPEDPKNPDTSYKGLYIWPEEGRGIVVGRTRKAVGKSYHSSYSVSYYGEEESESGFCAVQYYFPAYRVLTHMNQKGTLLIPHFALRLDKDS